MWPPENASYFFLNSLVPDRLTWKGNFGGIHTVRDGYNWLNKLKFVYNRSNNNSWKWVCIFLLLRRWKSSFGQLYINPFIQDQYRVIVVCSRRISILYAIKTLRWLYTTWETLNLLLAFANLLASLTHYFSERIVYMIRLDMASVVALSLWILIGGCGALKIICVLRMKWYLSVLWNSSKWIMLIC